MSREDLVVAQAARIQQLEALNGTLVQALHDSSLVLDLTLDAQEAVISGWGPEHATENYLVEIIGRVEIPKRLMESARWFKDGWVRSMLSLLPAIQKLEQWPKGALNTYYALGAIAKAQSFPNSYATSERSWRIEMDLGPLYWQLDDAAVKAAVRIFHEHPIDRPTGVLRNIFWRRDFSGQRVAPPSQPRRLIQFLREVSRQRTARISTERALVGKLPAELVEMVGDAIITQGGVPAKNFLECWSVPRPSKGVESHCPFASHGRNTWGSPWGCPEKTCLRRTLVEWCADERRWISTHQSPDGTKIARCNRACVDAACEGHHDQDFKDDDWVDLVDDLPWSFREVPPRSWG